MARLSLIFAIVFLMVMQAHADPRWGGGGGHGGGGHNWSRPWQGPVWRPHGYGYGYGYRDRDGSGFAGGVIGGAIGSFLWRQFNEPAVIVQEPPRTEEWCLQRFRSYDPVTRTYLGFDGLRHGCP